MIGVSAVGVTADGLLSTGTALLIAIVSGSIAVGISRWQRRTKVRDDAAVVWREQMEELRDRMAKQYEDRIAADHQQYEDQLKWYQEQLARQRKAEDERR